MKLEKALSSLFLLGLLVSSIALITIIVLSASESPNVPAKAEFMDNDLDIVFYPQTTYLRPGEASRFYFEITNKQHETIKKIDINVKISYLGKTVYEQTGASLREYKMGEKTTIFTDETLPLVTPPGEYFVQFYFRPENLSEKYLDYRLYVQPTLSQVLPLIVGTIILGLLAYLSRIKNFEFVSSLNFIKKNFELFTAGQKFIFTGIVLLILSAFTLALGLRSLADEFAMITYFLLVIGVTNSLLEYIKLGDPKINYTLSTYLLSAVIYLSIDDGLSKLIGEVATALSLFWAVSNFLKLSNKQRRTTLEISIVPLFLWILFNLARGAVPYYSATAVSLITIHLFVKKSSIPHLTQIADTLIKTTLKFVKPLIRSLDNADSKFRDIAVIYLISILLFFSLSNDGLNELVGKIVAVFVASWATLKLPELTAKQRRIALKTYSLLLMLWVILNLAVNSISCYSAGVLVAVLGVLFIYL